MPTCLYCRETKDASTFNREHVVPEAFGVFRNNFVLNGVVCEECNTYFGRHLDVKLARDSIEGLDRYEYEVRSPKLSTKFGGSDRLRARLKEGDFYEGAEVWWGPADDGGKLVLRPVPQFGVFDATGRRAWFLKDGLPARESIVEHGFVKGAELSIKPFGVGRDEAESILERKGYDITSFELFDESAEGTEADVDIAGAIDRVLWRAVSKIAFNYLAYHFTGIAMMEQFDSIRRYIRYDESPPWNPVGLSENEFLAGVTSDRAPVAHGVGVSLKGSQVIGQVTLFFRFHYRIVLANGGFLIPPTVLDRGDLFDPANHRIVEPTSDPRRCRPVRPPPDESLLGGDGGSVTRGR